MARKRFTETDHARMAELRERGMSYPSIAAKFGCSASAVRWACLRLGADAPADTLPPARRTVQPRQVMRSGHVVRAFGADEDEQLLALEAQGLSISAIGRCLRPSAQFRAGAADDPGAPRAPAGGRPMAEPAPTVVRFDPPRVERLWAYLTRDMHGNETICGAPLNGRLMPMVTNDPALLAPLTQLAEALASKWEAPIVFAEFTGRTDIRAIEGKASG